MAHAPLFDLAVNRALLYARRLGLPLEKTEQGEGVRAGLEPWYLKTRFAYRISLEKVVETLQGYPGDDHYWVGGEGGRWVAGRNPQP